MMRGIGKIIEQMRRIMELHKQPILEGEPDGDDFNAEWKHDVEALQETIAILSELQNAGIVTLPALKRMIQRYKFFKFKFDTPVPPKKGDGVLHCPQCNGRVQRGHTFCHKCGKKLGWV